MSFSRLRVNGLNIILVAHLVLLTSFLSPRSSVPDPRIIVIETSQMHSNWETDIYPMCVQFFEESTTSLELAVETISKQSSLYSSIGDIGFNEKQNSDLQMQLQVELHWDFSETQTKTKKSFGMRGLTIEYLYRGYIDISPEIYLLVTEPETQNLIEKVAIELRTYSFHIESEETTDALKIQDVFLITDTKGIVPESYQILSDIQYDLEQELTSILKENIHDYTRTSTTIKNK